MSDLKRQLGSALLVVLTVAAVVCASINYQQQRLYSLADDGVTWMDAGPAGKTHVIAAYVAPGSAGERAGIHTGDVLKAVGVPPVGSAKAAGFPIQDAQDVSPAVFRIGAFRDAQYSLEREGRPFDAKVILDEAPRDPALYYQYGVGIAYLAIGIFLFFRRSRAPKSLHFYLLCLVSFILHTFHYTGKLNAFDATIYVANVVAGLLAPALFLHFCFVFPEPLKRRLPISLLSIYLPALALMGLQLGIATGVIRSALPLIEMRWALDRAWLVLFCACYLAGGVFLHVKCTTADDPIMRKQLKWLRNGTLLGVIPFTALYVIPFVAGTIPGNPARLSVLFLAFLPLTWAYAILRYRLMDVDIIFQQGYVYLAATLSVMGVVYALVYALAKRDELSPSAVVLLALVAVFIFQPLRNWIQEQLDRYIFYKDQYDYRRTLIDFARELSSEMDLNHTLTSVGDRLLRTLSLAHVAFFLEPESGHPGQFELRIALNRDGQRESPEGDLDLTFLKINPNQPYLFFERTRHVFDVVSREWPATVRNSIARLDLTYYLPCVFRGNTVAWLGVSRTVTGDFLASDDVELLLTLSNYVAMAVENARLYRSLADKATQYERLKEFSENIVESINVGILAADLEDQVESWNGQIEKLTGIPRASALGRRLVDLFPPELAAQFCQFHNSAEVHQIYRVPVEMTSTGQGTQGRLVNVAIAPLVTKDGDRIGRLVIFDDVTEREDLQRRLVQADKLSSIGLLAAGVAHEVNTPLAVISSYAQMLAKQMNGDEAKTRLLDKIAKQTFRASEIVNSLLNFSRTSSTVDYDELNVNKVVREVASLLDHPLQKARVAVDLQLEEELPPIRGNFGRLQQVFLNLFLNARDAMENGGRLTVRSYAEGELVRLEVSDTGPGIPSDMLNRIFDPFFTTKMAKKGTGLGLSISYGIVEEHGGRIEALNTPGEGATFRLEFPAVRKAVNA